MRYRQTHDTNHTLDTPFGEVEVQFSADMADYDGALAHREGDHLVVAYLSHDNDPSMHPLDDCDGMGKIIGRGKYETRNHDESELFEALGLDRSGDPNYELVADEVNAAWKEYIESVSPDTWYDFIETLYGNVDMGERINLINKWRDELMEVDAFYEGNVCYCVMEAEKYVTDRDASSEDCRRAAAHLDFDVEKTTETLWRKAYDEGRIGNPDAVILDVYDHSGIAWSISGGGTQCRWDTSRGAGIWIPDACAKDEIERRAPVYATAYIRQTQWLKGKGQQYQLVDTASKNSIAMSDDWGDLWKMAQKYAEAAGDLTPAQLATGRAAAALELAQQALDEYNAWLSGDVYGVIVEKFDLVSEEDDEPVWEQHDDESCWGYVGSDYAKEAMTAEFEAAVKHLQNTNVALG